MNGIIVLLGAPNDDLGNLSSIAVERCLEAQAVYKLHAGFSILPTGGFGEFNKAYEPHAHYTRKFLLKLGIPANDILESALSRFTLEDAIFSKTIASRYEVKDLIVVTSDFHLERVELIFRHVFREHNLTFRGSQTNLTRDEINALVQHEKQTLASLKLD